MAVSDVLFYDSWDDLGPQSIDIRPGTLNWARRRPDIDDLVGVDAYGDELCIVRLIPHWGVKPSPRSTWIDPDKPLSSHYPWRY